MLFRNQALRDTRGWSGRRPAKYSWYAVSKTGSKRTADAGGGVFAFPLAFATLWLAFSLTLERVGAFTSFLSVPFSFALPGRLRHGCAVLGLLLPVLAKGSEEGLDLGKT